MKYLASKPNLNPYDTISDEATVFVDLTLHFLFWRFDMKRLMTTAMLFAAAGLTGAAYAAPISGTGFTADSIVEAGAADAASASTTNVAASFVLVETGYAGTGFAGITGNTIDPTGVVTTKNGTI
ncbi:MAG: hypothetical protein AB8C95_01750, partial [Phycisphaeraceae bacterium]